MTQFLHPPNPYVQRLGNNNGLDDSTGSLTFSRTARVGEVLFFCLNITTLSSFVAPSGYTTLRTKAWGSGDGCSVLCIKVSDGTETNVTFTAAAGINQWFVTVIAIELVPDCTGSLNVIDVIGATLEDPGIIVTYTFTTENITDPINARFDFVTGTDAATAVPTTTAANCTRYATLVNSSSTGAAGMFVTVFTDNLNGSTCPGNEYTTSLGNLRGGFSVFIHIPMHEPTVQIIGI